MTLSTTDFLLNCVIDLLTPFLLASGISDTDLARRATRQAIESTMTGSQVTLLTAAQLVALSLTTLDNLRLSMGADVSIAMKLRLRANAVSLSRAMAKHTEAPAPQRTARPAKPAIPAPEPAPPAPSEQQNRLDWSDAMRKTAAELQANAPHVSPTQRKTEQLWISVLNGVADDLRQPARTQPNMRKSELMRTTLLASNPDFPLAALAANSPRPAIKPK